MLTNGAGWRVYRVHFRQPIDKSLVFDLDVLQATARSQQLLECFGNLSREGFTPSSMAAVFQQQQATSKYSLAAMLQSEGIVAAVPASFVAPFQASGLTKIRSWRHSRTKC